MPSIPVGAYRVFFMMKKKLYGRFGVFAPLLLLITMIATTLRTVAIFLGVTPYGFFTHPVLSEVSAWFLVSGVLIALCYALTVRKKEERVATTKTPLTYVPAALLSLCFLFFGAERVPEALRFLGLFEISPLTITATLLIVLSAVSVAYTLALCLIESPLSDRRANLGMGCTLLFAVYAAFLYYDTTLPLNAPIKIADQMTYLALALYFLYEVRFSLGREKWGLYTSFGLIAGMMASYSAIPALLVYLVRGTVLSYSIAETILTLGALVFIGCRLLLSDLVPENRPIPIVSELIRVANKRSNRIAEVQAESTEATQEGSDAPQPIPQIETEPLQEDAKKESDASDALQQSFPIDELVEHSQTESEEGEL